MKRMIAYLVAGLLVPAALFGQDEDQEASSRGGLHAFLKWRALGPAVCSGRITDIAVVPGDPSTIYVAAASGGLWKTVNRGTTWTPVFEDRGTTTIGAIALSPADPQVIWVGTGEGNNQRSSYSGNGVHVSTDGGKSWKHCGLPDSHHIGRIVAHPTDPDTAFVAVLGHLYTPNEERGLYRTTDRGASFAKVIDLGPDVGVVDVAIQPGNSSVVLAAAYERRRRAWHFDESGPGSGLYRSVDGGSTFQRVEGGFPSGEIGRIGLAFSASDPATVYACVENRNPRAPLSEAEIRAEEERDAEMLEQIAEHDPQEAEHEAEEWAEKRLKPPLVGGEVYRSEDGGETWTRRNDKAVAGEPPYYYGQIRVDPQDKERLYLLGVPLFVSEDGARTFSADGARGIHVDHHALWIHPQDPSFLILGNDGGLAFSYDRGRNWDVLENLPIAQFYSVTVDDERPYRVFGGLQDNGSLGFPTVGSSRTGIPERDVFRVGGGDGFFVLVHPEDKDRIISEAQFGGITHLDRKTGKRTGIRPPRPKGGPKQRWNWQTPLLASPHDGRTVYAACQYVFRSVDFGKSWERISEDLTTADPAKMEGNVPHCTVTTLSESPVKKGVLWAGTDDGRVHVSHDGGRVWRDLGPSLPPAAAGLWVSRITASVRGAGSAYLAFTGYREDRFEPHLYFTEDYGGTWTDLSGALGRGCVNDVIEDPGSPDLVYVAQEPGVSVSFDGGDTFEALGTGMPPVPVHDLALQARDQELVAATHGRGLFALDTHVLAALAGKKLPEASRPFQPKMTPRGAVPFDRGYRGARFFEGEVSAQGMHLDLYLHAVPEADDKIVVEAADGRRVRSLVLPKEAGWHRVTWDLRAAGRGDTRGGSPRGGQGGRGMRTPIVPPGDYVLSVDLGGKNTRYVVRVEEAPVSVAVPTGEKSRPTSGDL